MNLLSNVPKVSRALLGMVLGASVLFVQSCGREGKARGSTDSGTAPAVLRPRTADDSGWFGVSGPERLDGSEDLFLPSGAGIRDLRTAGRDLLVLDTAGRLYKVTEGPGAQDVLAEPERGERISAMESGPAGLVLAEESGSVRAYFPSTDSGQGRGPGAESWSSTPGFRSDWVLDAEGSFVCVASDGRIAVLSASDGAVQAFRDLGYPFTGKPAVAGDVLAIPRDSGIVALAIPSLEFLWSGTRIPAGSAPFRTVDSLLAFQDRDGPVQVVEARKGTELYSVPAEKDSSLACDGDRWYVAGPDGRLGAFRVSDGVPVWTAGSAGADPNRERPLLRARLALDDSRLYLAGAEGLESWNSGTGERIERVRVDGEVDGLYLTPGRLHIRLRDGSLRTYGGKSEGGSYPNLDALIRPIPGVEERIARRLEAYAEPGTPVEIAWRTLIPGAVPSPDYRFTIFRYEVGEAGTRSFSQRSDGADRILVAVFDANGEERHSNVGELGVDLSFEYWLEAGIWYIAAGRLRGSELSGPVFLDIR